MIQHLCKAVIEMVTNPHEKQAYNFLKLLLFKGVQNELQLSMVEIAGKCN
jgi:hypothetical protein